jgi:signal transduction histidine kinase
LSARDLISLTQLRKPRTSGAAPIQWYRRISVKLGLGLGLAMFSIQLLATSLIFATYQANLQENVADAPARPYATYLGDHMDCSPGGNCVPTAEARDVIENFLDKGESYIWLDPQNNVVLAGELVAPHVEIGKPWVLCDSPEYCDVTLHDSDHAVHAGSSWSQMALGGEPVGTFVLVWFDDASVTAKLAQRQDRVELFFRLLASGLVAGLTTLLLVNLVTRRLSKLATDASLPVAEDVSVVGLPAFQVTGDDEIARLATALNSMRGRIQELVARIGERDRQRREWIAQVSHDLRTPLTALVACLDRLRERVALGAQDRGILVDSLNVARQDGQRLQSLVDDLFELARLDANEELNLEPVPPGELVRQTVRGLCPLAEARGITLVAKPAPALPTIRADGRRLMRALENMVRNAVYFGRSRVELRAVHEGHDLRFEVLDDGPGLPVKDGKVVLGPGNSHPRRADSAGLGLIVTGRVAAAHGGELAGANRPEGGARVWIRIPIVPVD